MRHRHIRLDDFDMEENNHNAKSTTVGRPKIDAQEKRVNTNVWLRKRDYESLKTRAKSSGLTYSAYCEKVLLTINPKLQTGGSVELRKEIGHIGNNINQAVKKLHLSSADISEQQIQTITSEILLRLSQIKNLMEDF